METSTIAIIVIAFFITVIIYGAIRHFRVKNTEDTEPLDYNLKELLTFPSNAIKEFEPIKSHIAVLRYSERCRDALHSAILKNLLDNGYVHTCKDPWRQAGRSDLPDLIELQNIITLKPVIEVIEDQYKRFEEARDKADKEHEFAANLIIKVMEKLKMDQEIQSLVYARGIDKSVHRNTELYKLLSSPEAKEIVERCIAEVLKGES